MAKKAEKIEPEKEAKETKKAPKPKKEKVKLTSEERKRSKKYRGVVGLVEKDKRYPIEEAVSLAKKTSVSKFDSSVEIHIRLNVNPSSADQQVRGTVVLPEGTGKKKRIAVLCQADKEDAVKAAGADLVGNDDLISDIEKGKIDFDILIATPEMMPKIGKLGRTLGTKGLMPNPKSGTVSADPVKTVKELQAGRIEFKVDKNGIIHQIIGKVSFDEEKLVNNYRVIMEAVTKAKPQSVKGSYLLSVAIATTMGPGIKVEL